MQEPFEIRFANGSIAVALKPRLQSDLERLLSQLRLDTPRPVMVVIGGASKLGRDHVARLDALFIQVLAPLAQSLNAFVIDGGTDTGVMQMMGAARCKPQFTFPLIGVLPTGVATLPSQSPPSPDAAPLEPNHTHFVLVPGTQWGDESVWIADIATALSGSFPSVTVMINGGEITWRDALASIHVGRRIVAIAGSGRAADTLVAVQQGKAEDDRAQAIVESGLLQVANLENSDGVKEIVQQILRV